MKKTTIITLLLLFVLSGCSINKNNSSKETNDTLSSSEFNKMLEDAQKQMKKQEKEKKDLYQKRLDNKEELVYIVGTVTSTLTKPESGFDFYQIDINIKNTENDKDFLIPNVPEFTFFISPTYFEHVSFKDLKEGDIVKIGVFKDSYVSPSNQISEEFIGYVEQIK